MSQGFKLWIDCSQKGVAHDDVDRAKLTMFVEDMLEKTTVYVRTNVFIQRAWFCWIDSYIDPSFVRGRMYFVKLAGAWRGWRSSIGSSLFFFFLKGVHLHLLIPINKLVCSTE